jgi:hypothetical protein
LGTLRTRLWTEQRQFWFCKTRVGFNSALTQLVPTILGVLDEDSEELLINPNLVENERHKLNVERRKQKSDYSAYDEETVDEFGMVGYFYHDSNLIPHF